MKINIQPRKFNHQQIQQAQAIKISDYYENRLPVFGITIDDVTTVDRDDGLWLRELNNGQYDLQVSITDVSQLIPKDSPIDQEAMQRVVTLYHTNPPTPMLPSRLSTNLGSLEEDKQTLAITIFYIIDRTGKIHSIDIQETIFTNAKAFSYEEVEQILQKPQNLPEHKMLIKMQKLAQLISKNRGGKSGILTEDGYLDEDGNLIQDNINAHQLIAELMILTNQTIANFLAQQNIPAIYRTQDVGTTDFNLAIKEMGHCLVPAQYEANSKPHVSLGLMNYMHFTSPLRRFVDLVNHRILKNIISQKSSPYEELELSYICDYINQFTDQFKLDRVNYLRRKKEQELKEKYSDLANLNIEQLSPDELSDLIQYTTVQKTICQITPQLKSRVTDLQPKDFYYIWFVAQINDFWHEDIDAVSVLLVKSQIDNSVVSYTYQSNYLESQMTHFCFCYIDGLTTATPVGEKKKNKAKQKAALASIQGYIENSLIPQTDNFSPVEINQFDGDFTLLSDQDFSKLLDSYLDDNWDDNILNAIEQRISNLPPKDLYKIWFEAKINNFFSYTNLDIVSVLLIHSQLNNTVVDYQFNYLAQSQEYHAHCYVDGLTHPLPQLDSKKSRAKHKAALAYIEAYINNQLINADIAEESALLNAENLISRNSEQQPETNSSDQNKQLSIDWISKLNQIWQSDPNNKLEYDFSHVDGIFVCMVCFTHKNQIFQSTGYGKSKKEAKQMACKIFFIQHQLFGAC